MKPTIFDPEAHVEAVAIRYDEGSETWQLQSIGTLEECQASCDRTRSKGCEEQMRVYRVGVGKDAARYRWLRKQNASVLRHAAYRSDKACMIDKDPDESEDDYTDRTIDAAMNDEP